MLKNNCLSSRDGLKMNGSSIGLGKSDTVLICNYCSKDVSVANMEEVVLTSHMKCKKHVQSFPSDQCVKSLMPPAPALPLTIFKISLSGVWSFQ